MKNIKTVSYESELAVTFDNHFVNLDWNFNVRIPETGHLNPDPAINTILEFENDPSISKIRKNVFLRYV